MTRARVATCGPLQMDRHAVDGSTLRPTPSGVISSASYALTKTPRAELHRRTWPHGDELITAHIGANGMPPEGLTVGMFSLPPEAKNLMADIEAFKTDIAAIRQLLERLVEIEESKQGIR